MSNFFNFIYNIFINIIKFIVLVIFLILFFGISFIIGVIIEAKKDLPNVSSIKNKIPVQTSEIFSSDNVKVAKLFIENRYWVSIKDIPVTVKNCLVASEDERFYQHKGVDIIAVIRGIISILINKEITQGSSTITQQLARILFLSPEVSIKRKLKEALIANELEKYFSKDEIMELYLNLVYFGEGAYGIEAAARTYFAKSCKDLNYPEAALIIGVLPAPSSYNPYVNFKVAKERQLYVLRKLLELNYISKQQYDEYINYPINLKREKLEEENILYPYYTTFVIQNFQKLTNNKINYEDLKTQGLKVYIALDSKLQDAIQKMLKEEIDKNKDIYNVHQAAIVLLENYTGRVIAAVGGYEYKIDDQFNRFYQAYRQPGSTFKIFVYTAALMNGFDVNSIVIDKVYNFIGVDGKPYSPVNWDNKYLGTLTLADAFALSRNTVAVYLANSVGIDKVIELAHKMGIKSKLEPYLSTALGASVVSPLEMATTVSTIANDGQYIEPVFIEKVLDRYGGIIFVDYINYKSENQVIPYEIAQKMKYLMKQVVDRGTGTNAKIPGINVYGKTGTTSDYRDAWFAGFTDDFTCVVWVGNDDYSKLNKVYGATLPALIFRKTIELAYKYHKVSSKNKKIKSELLKNKTNITNSNQTVSENSTKITSINKDETTSDTKKTINNNLNTTTVDYNTFPWENTTN
ncbi:MAG: transglycosylase domain-containing protein [bacterium]